MHFLCSLTQSFRIEEEYDYDTRNVSVNGSVDMHVLSWDFLQQLFFIENMLHFFSGV